MNSASCEAKYVTIDAIFSGRPILPTGIAWIALLIASSPLRSNNGVLIKPGATAFIVIPNDDKSNTNCFVKDDTAPFDRE
jgi:hypothetical protein